jgi:hypothetical protein
MRKYIEKTKTTTKQHKKVTKPTINGINKKKPKVYIKTSNCDYAKLSNLQVQL